MHILGLILIIVGVFALLQGSFFGGVVLILVGLAFGGAEFNRRRL